MRGAALAHRVHPRLDEDLLPVLRDPQRLVQSVHVERHLLPAAPQQPPPRLVLAVGLEVGGRPPRVDHDVGLGAVPGDVGGGVALGVEEGGVERLEAGGAVQEGLLPLAVVLDGGVAAVYAGLEVPEPLVAFRQ